MRINKIILTAPSGHFGQVLGRDNRYTHDTPPPSTIIGMLRLMYGEDIDNFVFGYTFESDCKYLDDITLYKHNAKGVFRKKGDIVTDCKAIEYHSGCRLVIYTDINRKLSVEHPICMGKSGNPARIHLPIEEINLIDFNYKGFNQYTPKSVGRGVIKPTNLVTWYKPELEVYEQQVEHLRFNRQFEYDKNYDATEKENIFLWQIKEGTVKAYD